MLTSEWREGDREQRHHSRRDDDDGRPTPGQRRQRPHDGDDTEGRACRCARWSRVSVDLKLPRQEQPESRHQSAESGAAAGCTAAATPASADRACPSFSPPSRWPRTQPSLSPPAPGHSTRRHARARREGVDGRRETRKTQANEAEGGQENEGEAQTTARKNQTVLRTIGGLFMPPSNIQQAQSSNESILQSARDVLLGWIFSRLQARLSTQVRTPSRANG